MNLQEIEDRVAQLDLAEGPDLIYSLLASYGLPKAGIARLRSGTYNHSAMPGETLWKNRVFDRYEADGGDLHALIDDATGAGGVQRERPRFLIVRDSMRLLALDTITRDTLDIRLSELAANAAFFLPWAGIEKQQLESLHYADVKAAQRMALLYEEISKANPIDTDEDAHRLNVFFTRMLFCFFAEDTNVFPRGAFTEAVASLTTTSGEDTAPFLDELFAVLDLPEDKRSNVPTHLRPFGYVNGSLFSVIAPAPRFTAKARRILIESGALNWSQINPDIFGSMMQAVVRRDQRGALGMHYTSVENIMRVIRPLFLDELEAALDAADTRVKLERLLKRISRIKFFDPACGSGNFLVIAYKELRRLEHRLLKRIADIDPGAPRGLFSLSQIKLENFYGIEIDDFAHEIATLSLWLVKHQMNIAFKELFGVEIALIPLKDTGSIECGNAASIDWGDVCPAWAGDEFYLLGNPPYQGAKLQPSERKADFEAFFGTPHYPRNLDYISLWFLKGAEYIGERGGGLAFVSTNSICQGAHVALLWPLVLRDGIEISFGHQAFQWTNQAKGQAGVTCIVVGLSAKSKQPHYLYSDGVRRSVTHINAYLRPSSRDTIVYERTKPLCRDLPAVGQGSRPNDGGNLVLDPHERAKVLAEAPGVAKYIKRYMGTKEFLNGIERYCLWIPDGSGVEAAAMPGMAERFTRVRDTRLASGQSANAVADLPYRFDFRVHQEGTAIIVPGASSERREYIPIGFLDGNTVISNLAYAIYQAEAWVFALISSRMHHAWVVAIAGRIRSDIRYSGKLCYNTFPVPPLTVTARKRLDECALGVLEAREQFSHQTLVELYDPSKMPPYLRRAHSQLDDHVDRLYRKSPFDSDDDRLELLFEMYEADGAGLRSQSNVEAALDA